MLTDAFAPALGEILFFGLGTTRDNQLLQMIIITVVLGMLSLVQNGLDVLTAASTVSPVSSEPAKFLFSFLSRVFLAVAFVQLDPFSLAFVFTACVKIGRLVMIETKLYKHIMYAFAQWNWRHVIQPV